MTLKCCVNFVFPFPPSFYHLVDWRWDLWNPISCTFSIQASLSWPLVCFWLLFRTLPSASPAFCLCLSLLDAHFSTAPMFPHAILRDFAGKARYLMWQSNLLQILNECRQELLVSSVIVIISGVCLLNYPRNPLRIGKKKTVYLAGLSIPSSWYIFNICIMEWKKCRLKIIMFCQYKNKYLHFKSNFLKSIPFLNPCWG